MNPDLIVNMPNTQGAEHWANAPRITDNTVHGPQGRFRVLTIQKLRAPSTAVVANKSAAKLFEFRGRHCENKNWIGLGQRRVDNPHGIKNNNNKWITIIIIIIKTRHETHNGELYTYYTCVSAGTHYLHSSVGERTTNTRHTRAQGQNHW